MASSSVEARSLSELNHLASNPSKYPRNPIDKKRDSLVLYISRVPGTSDIILSTLKPQLKNVTSADVENSLYYLHLNSPQELEAQREARLTAECRSSSSVQTIQRKPVGTPNIIVPAQSNTQSHETSPVASHERTPSTVSLLRKPLRSTDQLSSTLDVSQPTSHVASLDSSPVEAPVATENQHPSQKTSTDSLPSTTRKSVSIPAGPRPLATSTISSQTTAVGIEDLSSRIRDFTAAQTAREQPASTFLESPLKPTETITHSFSVTVIRRDPPSGAQWNVARLAGWSVVDDKPNLGTRVAPLACRLHHDMMVKMTNPAYNYFHVTPAQRQAQEATTRFYQSASGHVESAALADMVEQMKTGYCTSVAMEGNTFWANTKQRARAMSDLTIPSEATPEKPAARTDAKDNTRRGYAFQSIWQGKCKFSTGASGRSLRCTHMGSGAHTTEGLLSDLRFSLPLGVDLSKQACTEKGLRLQDQIRNKFASHEVAPPLPPRPVDMVGDATNQDDELLPVLPPRPSNTDDPHDTSEDDQVERPVPPSATIPEASAEKDARLDLSIGQEMAGGGNRGKRAKLGKLIIHDEGFKMLDLVVAANMGVFWSVWNSDR